MADQPLSSATDRRLGKPLPYQLANQPRAHLQAINLWPLYHAVLWSYAVLAGISPCCPPLEGRLLTCYSPVRHYSTTALWNLINLHPLQCCWTVRLACLKRAASVHPEPGSNSHIKIWWACSSNLLNVIFYCLFFVRSYDWTLFALFNYQGTCRIYLRRFIYYIILVSLSTLFSNFFEIIFDIFWWLSSSARTFLSYYISSSLSTLFSNFFEKLFCCFLLTFVSNENCLILLWITPFCQ